jgi:hypothetical protein
MRLAVAQGGGRAVSGAIAGGKQAMRMGDQDSGVMGQQHNRWKTNMNDVNRGVAVSVSFLWIFRVFTWRFLDIRCRLLDSRLAFFRVDSRLTCISVYVRASHTYF